MLNFKTNAACVIFREAVGKSKGGEREFSLSFEQLGVNSNSPEFTEALREIHDFGVLQVTVTDTTKIEVYVITDLSDFYE
jgi:hypothetical protein